LALLVRTTIRELPRGQSEGGRTAAAQDSIGDVLAFLRTRRAFVNIAIAASLQSLGGYAVLAWGPTFLGRVHGMDAVTIGTSLGLMIGFGGSAGAFLGGALGDRLGRRDPRGTMLLSAGAAVAGVPFVAAFLLLEQSRAALAAFLPFYVLANMYIGPMLSLTQGLVKLRMRATASAILLFVLNMVGLGLGPLLVGILNDAFAARFGAGAVRWSLLVVSLFGGSAASVFFLRAGRTLRRELAAAAE